jgi:hypothetical protein
MENLSSADHICLASTFDPSSYCDAKVYVVHHRRTTAQLRCRINEDEAIDPVDALDDARLLTELARVRVARRYELKKPPCPKEVFGLTLEAALARCAGVPRGWASAFDPLPYDHAARLVVNDVGTRDRLRGRIAEDERARAADEVLADAELLFELAKVRVRESRQRAQASATIMTLGPVELVRDKLGHVSHPGIPWSAFGEGDDCGAQFIAWGFELATVWFEGDASEDVVDRYFEQADPDVRAWNPTAPDGAGWFLASLHDTESGPCCLWIRHRPSSRGQAASQALAVGNTRG